MAAVFLLHQQIRRKRDENPRRLNKEEKHMNHFNRIASLLLAILFLLTLSGLAYAHEVPDENRKGKITVNMVYDGQPVSGGTLAAYWVGQIQEDNGNYGFAKTPDMEAFTGNYADLSAPTLAEEVAAFVQKNSVQACATAENTEGKAVFSELKLGLYLIVQTEASQGYEPLKPFLVTVPMNENGSYVYEVDAQGKFQLAPKEPDPSESNPTEPSKPTEPPKPTDPTLPQTGQLNWPVPVLAVLGLGLVAIGWLLCSGKKKSEQ